jgi:hypothetical protein
MHDLTCVEITGGCLAIVLTLQKKARLETGGSVHRAVPLLLLATTWPEGLLLCDIEPRYASINCRFDSDHLMFSF